MQKGKELSRESRDGYVLVTRLVSDFDGNNFQLVYAETPEGHYIGEEERARHLVEKRGIAPQLADDKKNVCSIGFCEKEQKWYGWSHRAIFGFGVGSTVKPGDVAYTADTPEGLIEQHVSFYADGDQEKVQRKRAECQILPDRSGIRILPAPLKIPMANSIEQALDPDLDPACLPEIDITADMVETVLCGRGEWTAQTLDDAKEMAIAFAKGVA